MHEFAGICIESKVVDANGPARFVFRNFDLKGFSMFRYTVQCEFSGNNPDVVDRWLQWLMPNHIQDVIDCGANSGEVIQLECDPPTFAINYTFEDKAAFETYESEHAPRLREEGLSLFPLSLGLTYSRTTAKIIGNVGGERQ